MGDKTVTDALREAVGRVDEDINALEQLLCDEEKIGRHLHPASERCLGAECCLFHDYAADARKDARDLARKAADFAVHHVVEWQRTGDDNNLPKALDAILGGNDGE